MNDGLRVKDMKQTMKAMLFAALLTFSPFHPLAGLAAVNDNETQFPFNGGTTSDSITIEKLKLVAFNKIEGKNCLQVQNKSQHAKMTFNIKVPGGKEANLRFKSFFKIFDTNNTGSKATKTLVSIEVKLNEQKRYYRSHKNNVSSKTANINIPSGEYEVAFIVNFEGAEEFNIAGCIEDLSLHIHRYNSMHISSEPLCGKPGKNRSHCDICNRLKVFDVEPKYANHSLQQLPQKKFSCLSSAGVVTVCEHCPYKEIRVNAGNGLTAHKFDASGKCQVCQLNLPKWNADTTVYEVHNAGEMRVLTEMVSLGQIPGNIGIDIKSDLVFSADTLMMPLGTPDHPFQGVLNGNGHRIRGIVNAYQGIDCLGFVGTAKGTTMSHAVIANLIFDSGNSLTGMACVGGIVGYAENCDIINCASFGSLEGTDNVGGIVGYAGRQVSILNCASMVAIRTKGKYNTMACGMPYGHILNSYGAASAANSGIFDELPTATLRHCFSSQASGEGLTKVSHDLLSTYDMLELLNEESESPCFTLTQADAYPVPVVNTTITAKANKAIPTNRSAAWRRAALSDDDDDYEPSEKDNEVSVIQGYVDDSASETLGTTIADIMHNDSTTYVDFDRVYIATHNAPEDAILYEPLTGGEMTAFEAYYAPVDSSYYRMIEYDVISTDRVMAKSETLNYFVGDKEFIDEYAIEEGGTYSLKSRIIFENENDIVCQESVDGIMAPVWSVQNEYDAATNTSVVNGYSYNHATGETHFEYSYTHSGKVSGDSIEDDDDYEQYLDSLSNALHIIYNYTDSVTGEVTSREDYILRASDLYLMEIRSEKVVDGEWVLTDGIYFIYDEEGNLTQGVVFAPTSNEGEEQPYMYYDYLGVWKSTPFPTAIMIPTAEQPSLQKWMDANIYDLQGRVVRRVTDLKNPFSGLPRGIYVYQGKKYIKK